MKTMTVMDIFKAILDKIVLVVIIPFLTISVASYVSYCVLEPTYTATTTMYVLDKGNSDTLQYSDLTTSALLIADYRELAVSSRVKDAAAKEVGLENLRGYKISVSSASNTRIIEITVVGKEPAMTANVANAIADNLSACIMDVMRVENISVIDSATPPVAPSGPDKIRIYPWQD